MPLAIAPYNILEAGENGKPKLVLAIGGGQVMANVLEILPEIEQRADVKIVAVTSPQLYEELRRHHPQKAHEILSDDERPLRGDAA